MKKSRLLGAVCGCASIIMTATWSTSAVASVIYDFVGDCTSVCTGQGTATLTLVDSYTPGDSFVISDFVSMSYLSTSIEYSFSASEILTLIASSMPVVSGPGDVNIDWLQNDTGFISNAIEWQASCGSVSLCTVSNGVLIDTGTIGTWTLRSSVVPIPPALWLFGSGLLGLIGISKRNNKQ